MLQPGFVTEKHMSMSFAFVQSYYTPYRAFHTIIALKFAINVSELHKIREWTNFELLMCYPVGKR